MSDCMYFPDTVEEFMEQYKMTDAKQVYSNGIEYVPIFRMQQWFEHEKTQLSQEGTTKDAISRQAAIDAIVQCTNCGDEDTLREYVLKHSLDNGWTGGILGALDAVKDLPPVQPVATDTNVGDKISRQAAIDAFEDTTFTKNEIRRRLSELPPSQPEPQWIPFVARPLTEEEKEEHPEWDSILVCELPDDGQRILVSVSVRGHESVQYDEFYTDDGSYLDSGYEIGTEAVAWMPLPEAYKPNNK